MNPRKNLRLPAFDYSTTGAYFVTICTHNRSCLFGEIRDDGMVMNDAGRMIHKALLSLPDTIPGIGVDSRIVMPNHVHCIITIGLEADFAPAARKGQAQRPAPTVTLPDIVGRFKSWTMYRYMEKVRTNDWPPFDGKLWQRNYYEHVIRTENDLNALRDYIDKNPQNWGDDVENVYR